MQVLVADGGRACLAVMLLVCCGCAPGSAGRDVAEGSYYARQDCQIGLSYADRVMTLSSGGSVTCKTTFFDVDLLHPYTPIEDPAPRVREGTWIREWSTIRIRFDDDLWTGEVSDAGIRVTMVGAGKTRIPVDLFWQRVH